LRSICARDDARAQFAAHVMNAIRIRCPRATGCGKRAELFPVELPARGSAEHTIRGWVVLGKAKVSARIPFQAAVYPDGDAVRALSPQHSLVPFNVRLSPGELEPIVVAEYRAHWTLLVHGGVNAHDRGCGDHHRRKTTVGGRLTQVEQGPRGVCRDISRCVPAALAHPLSR
jgi:hypothetical protein